MKEVVKLIEKVVTEKKIDRHQGLNAVLDFLIDIFDVRLITSDLRYMDMFLTKSHEMRFKNHQHDKNGKLVKVEAYFAEKVTVYREV